MIISLRNTFDFMITPPILTTFLLLLTAVICHIMARFAYSAIALPISAASTYLANCGKTGQILANQEEFKI